eukprot:snap_masked-scaffold_17-processed-gene-0.22-mRNA-1 protein AED:0.48 eAED:0.48 QI:0/-1/0/1/-1/1/1/0/1838
MTSLYRQNNKEIRKNEIKTRISINNYAKFSPTMLHRTIAFPKPKEQQPKQPKLRKQVSFFHDVAPVTQNPNDPSPSVTTCNSIVMFVDISGFTRLCTQLKPEVTKKHINTYFTLILDIIYKHGGDVHKFIGDALIVIWPFKIENIEEELTDKYREKGLKAVKCALDVVGSECSHYDKQEGDVEVRLRLHIGITHGVLQCFHVGGQRGCGWEYIVAGQPLGEMALALDNAQHGQIGISSKLYHILNSALEAKDHPSGIYIVHKLENKPFSTQNELTFYLNRQKEMMVWDGLKEKMSVKEFEKVERSLGGMVPGVARAHCENNSLYFLSEVRQNVTIMFININDLISTLNEGELDRVQSCFTQVSTAILDQGGTFMQFVYDDKGVVAIGAFGLPGFSHEDDIQRGLKAAFFVVNRLNSLGLSCHIGLTTGRVYCGLVGSEYRQAFGVMGASMNLAARLMGACMKLKRNGVHIVCNEDLREKALDDQFCEFTFEAIEPVIAKGYIEPVKVYIPQKNLRKTDSRKNIIKDSIIHKTSRYYNRDVDAMTKDSKGKFGLFARGAFVGREKEMKQLQNLLEEDTKVRFVAVEASSGTGKSTLLRFFAQYCLEETHASILSLRGESGSFGIPLASWGHVVRDALKFLHEALVEKTSTTAGASTGIIHTVSAENVKDVGLKGTRRKRDITQNSVETTKALVAALGQKYRKIILLLYPLFPCLKTIPVNSEVKAIQGSKQETSLQLEMVISLLITYSELHVSKIILMVEDAHWLDELSWKLLEKLAVLSRENFLVVTTIRPVWSSSAYPPHVIEYYRKLLTRHKEKCIKLELLPLTKDSCTALLKNVFNSTTDLSKSFRAVPLPQRNGTTAGFLEEDEDLMHTLNSSEDEYDEDSEGEDAKERLKDLLNSDELASFVYDRCSGNPLFLLGIAQIIQEQSASLQNNSIAGFLSRLNTIMPESVNQVINSRFDKLSVKSQLILKTCCIIGYYFSSSVLKQIREENAVSLEESLIELENCRFIAKLEEVEHKLHKRFSQNSLSKSTSDSSILEVEFQYSFEHMTVFDAVNQLILDDQRKKLHEAVGKYYQREYKRYKNWLIESQQMILPGLKKYDRKESVLTVNLMAPQIEIDEALSMEESEGRKLEIGKIDEEFIAQSKYSLLMKVAYHWSRTDRLHIAVKYLKKAAEYIKSIGVYAQAEELFVAAVKMATQILDKSGVKLDAMVANAPRSPRPRTLHKTISSKGIDFFSESSLNISVAEVPSPRSSFGSPSSRDAYDPHNRTHASLKSPRDQDSFKDFLSGVNLVVNTQDILDHNSLPQALLDISDDLCNLFQIYSRYKVPPRKETNLSPPILLRKAELAQQKFTELNGGKPNARGLAMVCHQKAYNVLYSDLPREFNEFIRALDPSKRFNSVKKVEESFRKAVALREREKDFPGVAESLNGLGTFYEELHKKLSLDSTLAALESSKEPLALIKQLVPEKFCGIVPDDANLKDVMDSILKKLELSCEQSYMKCFRLREKYDRSELGQVQTSLGNFYLYLKEDLLQAKPFLKSALDSYVLDQGSSNPRSGYALLGLANCYKVESDNKKDELAGVYDNSEYEDIASTVNTLRYISLSLAQACLSLRKLTVDEHDSLYMNVLRLMGEISSGSTWPWDKPREKKLRLLSPVNKFDYLHRVQETELFVLGVKKSLLELTFYVGWSVAHAAVLTKLGQRCFCSMLCYYFIRRADFDSLIRPQVEMDSFALAWNSSRQKSNKEARSKDIPVAYFDFMLRWSSDDSTLGAILEKGLFDEMRLIIRYNYFDKKVEKYWIQSVILVLLAISGLADCEPYISAANEYILEHEIISPDDGF